MYLERIASPTDLRALPASALPDVCTEIREAIVKSSSAVGGHLASNLGIVELTVALHCVFDDEQDRLILDVSHQCYPHKILTGRAASFIDPAHYDEVSGFANPAESPHDRFAMGHTSTSISLATGLAKARDLTGDTYDIVAVIGDGALSGGLAFEGLNNAANVSCGLIIVINDNEWSIAPNVGGIYRNLAELRASTGHAADNIFKALGFEYHYLEDGNDVFKLIDALAALQHALRPVVLHVHTTKGAGYTPAEHSPESWHHVGPFDLETGTPTKTRTQGYAEITAEALRTRMHADPRVVVVSAATPYIMGFTPETRLELGARFVDVGIAEEHALTYVTALACAGAKPVLGIYATFLQRAYDEIWHDLCLNDAPAIILVFGASIYGTTDATHLGFFDIPLFNAMPHLSYLAPTCTEEYLSMLDWALAEERGPVAIRVPVAEVMHRPDFEEPQDYRSGSELVRKGNDLAILALGDFFSLGEQLACALEAQGLSAALINPRNARLPDTELLSSLVEDGCTLFVTLEDGIVSGGFGEHVAAVLAEYEQVKTLIRGLPCEQLNRYKPEEVLRSCRLTLEDLCVDVRAAKSRLQIIQT